MNGYTGERVAIFDDVRVVSAGFKWGTFLKITAEWPCWVDIKGKTPCPWMANMIVFTGQEDVVTSSKAWI